MRRESASQVSFTVLLSRYIGAFAELEEEGQGSEGQCCGQVWRHVRRRLRIMKGCGQRCELYCRMDLAAERLGLGAREKGDKRGQINLDILNWTWVRGAQLKNPLEPLLLKLAREFTDDQDLSERLQRLYKVLPTHLAQSSLRLCFWVSEIGSQERKLN